MANDLVNHGAIQAALSDLELQRKVVARQNIRSYLFITGGFLLLAAGLLSGNFVAPGVLTGLISVPFVLPGIAVAGGVLLITGFIFYSRANTKFTAYRYNFKQNIVSIALKFVDESLNIDYTRGLTESDFIYSRLFSKEPDRYRSEDQVSGRAGKTEFSFSELHAEYKTVTQTKHGRREHWHTIFKGIVFYADFNKNFNGITVVRPKDAGAALGAWISKTIPVFSTSNKQLVALENPEFSSEFITYSTDQVEARYILTPSLMERLCALNKRCRYTISLSFIGSKVFIAFPLDKDYFEPPVYKSLLETSFLDEDIDVIRFMYGIIKNLDLNTRIWTKA